MISQSQRRQALKRAAGINLDDLHEIATDAARPKTRSAYPKDCLELSGRYLDKERNRVYGEITNAQRDKLAKNMPWQDLTNRHGESRRPMLAADAVL